MVSFQNIYQLGVQFLTCSIVLLFSNSSAVTSLSWSCLFWTVFLAPRPSGFLHAVSLSLTMSVLGQDHSSVTGSPTLLPLWRISVSSRLRCSSSSIAGFVPFHCLAHIQQLQTGEVVHVSSSVDVQCAGYSATCSSLAQVSSAATLGSRPGMETIQPTGHARLAKSFGLALPRQMQMILEIQ